MRRSLRRTFFRPERYWRVRLTRVRLLRHALPISLLILRKKPTVLQSKPALANWISRFLSYLVINLNPTALLCIPLQLQKEAVIFTCCLKEVIMAPFVVLMLFRAILIIPCEKVACESIRFFRFRFIYSFTRLAPVPSRKMIIWSRNCPFVIVLRWKENGASFFICVFYLLWIHKTQGETKLDGRSCIFLTYEWLEFPYLEPQRSRKSCSNCPFLYIFSRSGNLRLLNWKNKVQKNKRA